MPEKLIFGPAFGAMLEANRDTLGPDGVRRLRGLGIEPAGPFLAAYPARTWADCTRVLAEELHPGLDLFEGSRQVARVTVDAFAQTLVGRLLFGLTRLIGPERTFRRMTENLRSGSNFIETKITTLSRSPLIEELWINDVTGLPGYYQGLLERGTFHTAGYETGYSLVRCDGVEAVFRREPPPPRSAR